MSGRHSDRGHRLHGRTIPGVERLDARELLSSGAVGHSLGPSLVAPILPRVSSTATLVDPHNAINQFLSAQLGSGVATVEQHAEATNASSNAQVTQQVLSNGFIHAVLNRQDTYTLLNSVATTALGSSAATTTSGTAQQGTVTYTIGTAPGEVTIAPNPPLTDTVTLIPVGTAGAPGIPFSVPTSSIRITSVSANGTITGGTVVVPQDLIPPGTTQPSTPSVPTGPLTSVFTATGPLILSALKSAVPRSGPNAPRSIPGLRLAGVFAHGNNFPTAHTNMLLYAFRVAVDRNVFALNASQTTALNAGILEFETAVAAIGPSTFQPSVPPAAPALPKGPLYGTLEVSLGALRNLNPAFVDPTQTGLQLTGVGNFPGRFDVGFVFDRSGNFGIELTARGPLLGAPSNVASANVVAGDVRVEVSNAQNLSALTGLRTVEGLTQGTALESGIETATYSNGVKTFAASAGYGSGLEFGTGMAYTQIIPLGNVYALIPASPKQPFP